MQMPPGTTLGSLAVSSATQTSSVTTFVATTSASALTSGHAGLPVHGARGSGTSTKDFCPDSAFTTNEIIKITFLEYYS